MAQNLGWFEAIEEKDDSYNMLMNEWKKAML